MDLNAKLNLKSVLSTSMVTLVDMGKTMTSRVSSTSLLSPPRPLSALTAYSPASASRTRPVPVRSSEWSERISAEAAVMGVVVARSEIVCH